MTIVAFPVMANVGAGEAPVTCVKISAVVPLKPKSWVAAASTENKLRLPSSRLLPDN